MGMGRVVEGVGFEDSFRKGDWFVKGLVSFQSRKGALMLGCDDSERSDGEKAMVEYK